MSIPDRRTPDPGAKVDFPATILGAMVGALVGGPAGAVLGAGFGAAAKALFGDMALRQLSKLEEVRLGNFATAFVNAYQSRLLNNRTTRSDWGTAKGEDDGTQILEMAMQKVRNDPIKAKTQLYAQAFANILTDDTISAAEAQSLLQLGESLTYRQIVIIALFRNALKWNLRTTTYKGGEAASRDEISATREAFRLAQEGLIQRLDETSGGGRITLLQENDLVAAEMALTNYGRRFYDVFQLSIIPESELAQFAALFPPESQGGLHRERSFLP